MDFGEAMWAVVNALFWTTGLIIWTSGAFWLLVLFPTFLAERRFEREDDEFQRRRRALDALTQLHEGDAA